jgi:NitT/TauT family transport system permease protein
MSNATIAQGNDGRLPPTWRSRASWLPRAFDWSRYGHVVVSHLLLLGAWQALVAFGKLPAFVLPTPIATAATLAAPGYRWISNTLATAVEVYGGYVLGVAAAVALALLFCWFRTIEKLLMPVLVSFNMIPKVALGPLVIVWFKYGIGAEHSDRLLDLLFPRAVDDRPRPAQVDPELLDLINSLKGSKWQLFTKIQLPSALPYVFSGMKVGAILAVASAIVGEFLGSDQGLGYLMLQVQVSLDTPAMFMALLLITAVGMSLYGLVLLLERMLVSRDARLS